MGVPALHCCCSHHLCLVSSCSMLGGRAAFLVWLVTTSSRMMVTGEEPSSCSLLLTAPGVGATYTVTSTELNVNFAAEFVELTVREPDWAGGGGHRGQCCFAIYSHPTKAKGEAMMVNSGNRLASSLPQVGSAFMISCSENSGTIIMHTLLAVSAILIGLILVFALISTFGRKCRGQMFRRGGGGGGHHTLQEEKTSLDA